MTENYQEMILDLIESRLAQTGPITIKDIWSICKDKFHYNTMTRQFRAIMLGMVEQGKAKKIRNGLWEIVVPDKGYKWDLKEVK